MADASRSDETTQETPNRATLALVDAKVDGLKDLVRAEFASVRASIAMLVTLPQDVSALRAEIDALDKRETAADEDMDRRVSDLEDGNTRKWSTTWAVVAAIVAAIICAAPGIIALFANG